jgi:hypothetical protein
MQGAAGEFRVLSDTALAASWRLGDDTCLTLLANLGAGPVQVEARPWGDLSPFFTWPQGLEGELVSGRLSPWAVAWFLGPD